MTDKNRLEANAEKNGLGGIARNLGGILDLLVKLAERADGEISRSGEVGDDQKGFKAVYGFSVRLGGGGKPLIEKFGNVKDDGRGPVVDETREPMVDVFDEGDHLLVVAELPGVDAKDVQFEVKDDVLNLSAAHGDRKYRKEVLLPSTVQIPTAAPSFRNGVFELNLTKVG